jgi:CDP-4-dehydro-6-deoxyglucose reductase, E1
MNKIKYPLASSTWDQKEIEAIHKVIDSGMYSMGKHVKDFEKKFASHIGSKYAIMVNSGSSANLLMIASLFFTKIAKLKRGDEVIVPAVSWSTTYIPLQQYGLKLRFVDIDINTLNIDLNMLERSITKKTKMIFLVNLLGNPNDFDRINDIIGDKEIFFIEDNCESLGAKYNDKSAGTFGLMGSFSSFFSHHICTMEGGLVVTDDEELYHIMLSLRAHGWTRNLPDINCVTGKKDDNEFNESFNFVLPGFNLRPLEIEGAIGAIQLDKLNSLIDERRKNAEIYKNAMDNHSDIMIQAEIGESSWFGFSMIIKKNSSLTRKDFIEKLNSNGFETRPIVAGNFTRNPVLKYFNYEIPFKLKNADFLHDNGLFIGNHHFPLNSAINELTNI